MSRTYTFEEFVNMPREEAAAIIEAENKEFHEAVQRACSGGLDVAPTEYSEWLTGPTTEECGAPVETTEPEAD